MSRIDELAERYRKHISAPWQPNLTGAERTTWLVYPKQDERRLASRLPLFEESTLAAGHSWVTVDFTMALHRWFTGLDADHQTIYLEEPESLHAEMDLGGVQDSGVTAAATAIVRDVLERGEVDAATVLAFTGIGSLFGFTRLTAVLERVRHDIPGHLAVFFPGTCDGPHFRLFDATDGSGYLGVVITPHSSLF